MRQLAGKRGLGVGTRRRRARRQWRTETKRWKKGRQESREEEDRIQLQGCRERCGLTVTVLGLLHVSLVAPRHRKAAVAFELVVLRLQGSEAPRQGLILALQGLQCALELLNVGPRVLPRALGREAVLDHPHSCLDGLLVHLAQLPSRVHPPLFEEDQLLELALKSVVLLHRPPHLGLGCRLAGSCLVPLPGDTRLSLLCPLCALSQPTLPLDLLAHAVSLSITIAVRAR
mmetsp:Transcript_9934/g.24231  ORF Transcript_9934/g.24231 Transcript_9934/m.24231 type:complete len:230 (+) Transcript_9934:520-1209(+)